MIITLLCHSAFARVVLPRSGTGIVLAAYLCVPFFLSFVCMIKRVWLEVETLFLGFTFYGILD